MIKNKMLAIKHKPLAINGYTLIELLVGISIISIIFAIGYASFREFSRRQALTGIVRKVTADLRLTQQLALTGEKPASATCTRLEGYGFVTSSNAYTVSAICSNGNTVIKDVTMETGITLSVVNIIFKVLGQGTNITSSTNIDISHSVTGNSSTVTVGKGGEIK